MDQNSFHTSIPPTNAKYGRFIPCRVRIKGYTKYPTIFSLAIMGQRLLAGSFLSEEGWMGLDSSTTMKSCIGVSIKKSLLSEDRSRGQMLLLIN